MSAMLTDLLGAIGDTKMVNLSRITEHFGVEGNIFAKLEYMSPGFSKKDRVALQMIEEAEASGQLKPGQHVVEVTSGNTGIGLAIVCGIKGYHFVACLSKGNSIERANMIKALGAELVLVDQGPNAVKGKVSGEDLLLVEEAAKKLVEERGAFRADQFRLQSAANAHRLHTAREMWEQSEGKLDVFVEFVGSGSTFQGCALGLRERNKDIRNYVVEPENAAIYAGDQIEDGMHRIQGGGYGMEMPLVDKSLIDGSVKISDEEAVETTRLLAQKEGIFAGFSSGANVYAAIKLLQGKEKGKNIGLLINDSGLKYMSTDLFG